MNEKRGTRILDCPWLDQREKWPTGCESVSAALCLQYAGFDVTPDYFIDNCLPRAGAPRESRRWIIDGTGEVCVWKTPMHCLLLIGYDGDSAVFSDPLAGPRERYSLRDTDIAYRGMGTQAVVVHPARRGNCVNGL